jgi:hypothetical protein
MAEKAPNQDITEASRLLTQAASSLILQRMMDNHLVVLVGRPKLSKLPEFKNKTTKPELSERKTSFDGRFPHLLYREDRFLPTHSLNEIREHRH